MNKTAFLLCLLLCTTDAQAFRCGRQLVQEGDHKLDVLEKCGEPEWTDQRITVVASRLRHPYGALEYDQYEEIVIDEWVYNFGSRKFKQFLQFENGVLKKIKNLSYGR
ncbi:DUF2845 domain-containing protein [Methylomonas sp. LL1]|uniref:DUF2845 domain-containing protein n=1 Tax=Methylomonas sp. LL1 TaxID=2785785 RepID=UPI0018C396BD|nr:DUF2845 domain-containing protein [Methylomonas sp. LL1]QPK63658.1 DUF2845 domain-containing protein [Methylomonas sp. LL1]